MKLNRDLIFITLSLFFLTLPTFTFATPFIRGDVDGDGTLGLADAVRIINYIFGGKATISNLDAADIDDSGVIDVADSAYLIRYIFQGGDAPQPPFPAAGCDPTPDEIGLPCNQDVYTLSSPCLLNGDPSHPSVSDLIRTGAMTFATRSEADKTITTYTLLKDIEAPGSAFGIGASNIILDLNGHTVIYNTTQDSCRYGVAFPAHYSGFKRLDYKRDTMVNAFPDFPEDFAVPDRERKNITVKNGSISQFGKGDLSDTILIAGEGAGWDNVIIDNLYLKSKGDDSKGIYATNVGFIEIKDSTVDSEVSVVTNRHQGVDGIYIKDPRNKIEVHHNRIINQPQWGIRVYSALARNKGESEQDYQARLIQWVAQKRTYTYRIYDNQIRNAVKTTNGYAIGVESPYLEVFRNQIGTSDNPSKSRGIHISSFYNQVYDNQIYVSEPPNPEYSRFNSHGIKLEGAIQAKVYGNTVVSWGDFNFDLRIPVSGDALDIDVPVNSCSEIYNNRFRAIRRSPQVTAFAVNFFAPPDGNMTIIHNNTFESNHYLLQVEAGGGSGVNLLNNTFRFVTEDGAYNDSKSWVTLFYRLINKENAKGVKFYSLNNFFADNTFESPAGLNSTATQYNDYEQDQINFYEGHKITLIVKDSGGRAVSGARVWAEGQAGGIPEAVTDAEGKAMLVLSQYKFSYRPGTYVVDDKQDVSRHTIKVEKDGLTAELAIICDVAKTVEILLNGQEAWILTKSETFATPMNLQDGQTFGTDGWLTAEIKNGGSITVQDGKAAFLTPEFRASAMIRLTNNMQGDYKVRVKVGNVKFNCLDYSSADFQSPDFTYNCTNPRSWGCLHPENGFYWLTITDERCGVQGCGEDWWHAHRKLVIDSDDHIGSSGEHVRNPLYLVYMNPAAISGGEVIDGANLLRSWKPETNIWDTSRWNWNVAYTFDEQSWYYAEIEKSNGQVIMRLYDASMHLIEETSPVSQDLIHGMGKQATSAEYVYLGEPHISSYKGTAEIAGIWLYQK